MRYGYVRSATQNKEQINNQMDLLKPFNIDKFIVEETGHDLENLIKILHSGDSLHVVSIDRLSRNVYTCKKIISDLLTNNITVYIEGKPIWFTN